MVKQKNQERIEGGKIKKACEISEETSQAK